MTAKGDFTSSSSSSSSSRTSSVSSQSRGGRVSGSSTTTSSTSRSRSYSNSGDRRTYGPVPDTQNILASYAKQMGPISAPPNSAMFYEPRKRVFPFISLGPVIGMVTSTSARILIETSSNCEVRCYATDRTGVQHGVMVTCLKGRPTMCVLDRLHPDTYYRVTFDLPVPGLVKAGFTTLPSRFKLKHHNARFGVVSGNSFYSLRDDVPHQTDLWRQLYKTVNARQLDYILHLGNGVYVDSDKYKVCKDTKTYEGPLTDCPYLEAVRLMEAVPYDEWSSVAARVKEMFRNAYRTTWNHPTTKHCLANCPNIFIMDDHELEDGFGYWTKNRDPNSLEYFLNCCAYDVYNEYCRQLFEDYPRFRTPLHSVKVGQAYHFHAFGDIGIMMLDTRMNSTLHKDHKNPVGDDMYPMLGSRQWNDIEFALSPGGYLGNVKMLLVCAASPVCLCGEQGYIKQNYLSSFKEGFESCWNNTANMPEASLLLHRLFDWRAEKPGVRNFCLVAGNGVEGGVTDIVDLRYYGAGDSRLSRAKQVVVGPIGNVYDKKPAASISAAPCGISGVGANHQFSHYNKIHGRNYAIIEVPMTSFGVPMYEVHHYGANCEMKWKGPTTLSSYEKGGMWGGSPVYARDDLHPGSTSCSRGRSGSYVTSSRRTSTTSSSSSRERTASQSTSRFY